jgi:7,8-dihydro-6-hydroxymethylpterin dimethyltransferase
VASLRPLPRADRDEVFLEQTKSICPVCKAVVDAEVNARDDRAYLRKRCRDHGSFEALVFGDAEMYMEYQRFNKPGTLPLAFQTEVRDGCPLDCGLCPDHKQHACSGLIEVNSACNLDCPICFADSGTRVLPPASRSRLGLTPSSPPRASPRW